MKTKEIILFILISCYACCGVAQKTTFHNLISLTEGDLTTKVYIQLEKPPKYKPKEKLTYYYYHKNVIQHAQGGYTGSLLHGLMQVTNQQQQLIKKGNYNLGIKTGQWIEWHSNGKIAEISHWKKGQPNGSTKVFDTNGNLTTITNYRKGELHGVQKSFNPSGEVSKSKYRKGKLIEAKGKGEKGEKGEKKGKKGKKKKDEKDEKDEKKNKE